MRNEDSVFAGLGEVAALMRATDWSKTPLGSPDAWPSSLRTVLRLMLTSRYAMWLGWGRDLLFFYNDAYRQQTLGAKHPAALARPFRVVWEEIWEDLAPRINHVMTTGEATWDEGLLLFLERNGYSEETYHTFSYSPCPGDGGAVGGLFCVVIEETERVLAERRAALLREFASAVGPTKTTAEVLAAMERCLANDGRDVPFSLTYLFDDGGEEARLASRTVIAEGHAAAPAAIRVAAADSPWPLAAVWAEQRAVEVPLSRGERWPTGHWKKPPALALVVPIAQAGQARPAGAFVAGVNPHRALDPTFRSFIELFVGQLAAGLANARAYENEKKRAEALAQIDRAKTAFFSNVSHEFRTPLTLMLGPTEDALASPERALAGEALEIVHRNELRLLKLVNALLDFSRIEAGRVQATYVPTDLTQLTADLASAFRSAMERGGLRYTIDCEPVAAPVYVDRDMWEKIVLNLVSNALKFTFEGHVRVALRQVGESVELQVEDTGPGVAPAELPRMFERFHRVEGTPARTHEGSGIGLALVRDLVELHGGTIRIESELGRGSVFTVTLPTGSAHLPREHVAAAPPAGPRGLAPDAGASRATAYVAEALRWVPADPAAPAAPGAQLSSTAPRILVADDNADMREYVARLLRQHWNVELVGDGEAALEAIRRDPPALVVSDVMMPRLDGFGLVRRLRADPATRTVPVILVSARAGVEATDEGLSSGANDYLTKPFSARELIARVSSQLAIVEVRKAAEAEKEAERRVVESLFMNAPAGITLLRGDRHVIEFANPMALEIWGKGGDVVGRPLFDVLPELRGKGFDDLLRQVMQSGVAYVGEDVPVTFRRGGKEEILHLKFVYAPAYDAAGRIDGVAAFGFDVTAQVDARTRATLAATVGRAFVSDHDLSSQLARCCDALVEAGAASAGIWTYNAGHQTLELRATAGAPTPLDPADGGSAIGQIAKTGRPRVTNRLRDDASVVDPAWAAAEGLVAFAGYALAVGERVLGVMALFSKQELSAATLDALATVADQVALGIDRDISDRFRDLFIGMLGHDLRNPLNSVNVGAHLLATVPSLTPVQRQTVERIRNSASRMNRMITQVLDFARARAAGAIPIERTPADVGVVCAQVVEELAAVHPERRVLVECRGDTAGAWDVDRLAQVFSNLIGNALVYGRPGAPVTVVVAGSATGVECTVHNHGDPIPAELLPRLFDPFRRATHGKSAGTRGLGLGLFIAQQIVAAHGGTLSVRSSEAQGTSFRFDLPRHGVSA